MDGYRSFAAALVVTALGLSLVSAHLSAGQLEWGRRAVAATGEVTGFRHYALQTGEACQVAEVRYVGERGRPETLATGLCVNVSLYAVGQRVPVLYQPGAHGTATLNLPWERWRLPLLWLLAALLPFLPALLLLRSARQHDQLFRTLAA